MTDPVPSKDVSSQMRSHRLIHELRTALSSTRGPFSLMDKAADEIERLQRQVDELSIHAEKWVKRALGGAQPPSPIPFAGVAKGVSYEALANATYPERMYGGDSPAFACIDCGASVPGPNAYCEACFLRARRGARALAESAYRDGYGADLTDDRDLSERTHELIRSLSRPAHEASQPFEHPYAQHPHHVCTCGAKVPSDVYVLHTCGDRLTPKGSAPEPPAEPTPRYQCMVKGCPANHVSKWDVCDTRPREAIAVWLDADGNFQWDFETNEDHPIDAAVVLAKRTNWVMTDEGWRLAQPPGDGQG